MNFALDTAHAEVRTLAATFACEQLAPHAARREREHRIEPAVFATLGKLGLLGMNIPTEFGGSAQGVVGYAVALREITMGDASVAVTMAVTNMVGEVIFRFGNHEQRSRYLPKLASGTFYGGAFGLSEPGAGSDAGALSTRATPSGDGYVLNGQKMWITTGDDAGVIIVWARTGEAGSKGLSCFLVEHGTPGMSVGKPEEKMGLRASHTVALSFTDCVVPKTALLGELGLGFKIAMNALDGGRIGIGAQAVGIGTRALGLAKEGVLAGGFGDGAQRDSQAYQFELADMATELDAAWLLTLRAALLKQKGEAFSLEAAMAKVFGSETANKVVRSALQLAGMRGQVEDNGVARLLRDCRVTQIYEGTSEVQRMVIGRTLLKAS